MQNSCRQNSKGQTIVEYSLLLGIAIAVLLALTPMIKRSTQGMVKIVADEVGYQNNAEQKDGPGLVKTSVATMFDRQLNKKETSLTSGGHRVEMIYSEVTTAETQSLSGLGASSEE